MLLQGIHLFPQAVLIVVVIQDVIQPTRYRWTHWLGPGIALWFATSSAIWLVWITLAPGSL